MAGNGLGLGDISWFNHGFTLKPLYWGEQGRMSGRGGKREDSGMMRAKGDMVDGGSLALLFKDRIVDSVVHV